MSPVRLEALLALYLSFVFKRSLGNDAASRR
jgi:hypothetical protein